MPVLISGGTSRPGHRGGGGPGWRETEGGGEPVEGRVPTEAGQIKEWWCIGELNVVNKDRKGEAVSVA